MVEKKSTKYFITHKHSIKFKFQCQQRQWYWNTAVDCLRLLFATTAELRSCDRDQMAHEGKIFTI